MCGRYTNTGVDVARIAERFAVTPAQVPKETLGRFNVCPTETVLGVVPARDGGGREARGLRWGLEPWWRRGRDGPRPINARSEGISSKPMFASLMARGDRRCLIVADGWYEWLRPEKRGAPRTPFRYTVDGGALFAFAGLWEPGRGDPSTCILTTEANAICRAVHDRMPCVLAGPEEEAAWLSSDLDGAAAEDLLAPLGAARVQAAPANPAVNRAGVEGPELLAAPTASLFAL